MIYTVKTRFGEYEITEEEKEELFENIRNRGKGSWFDLPGGIMIKGDWDMVPKKDKENSIPLTPDNLSEVLTETVVALHDDSVKEVPLAPGEAEAFDPALESSCCDTNSGIRWKVGKDNKKRYMMQCTVCLKKGKPVKTADVENPDEVLEVK